MLKTVFQVLIPLFLAVLLGLLLAGRFLPESFGSFATAFLAERTSLGNVYSRLAVTVAQPRERKTAPAPASEKSAATPQKEKQAK